LQSRLLLEVPELDAGHAHHLALVVVVHPGHDLEQRRLPEPLSPSTPILAPGKKLSEMFFRMVRFGGTVFATRRMV
jgi:hypothetical protein